MAEAVIMNDTGFPSTRQRRIGLSLAISLLTGLLFLLDFITG
jgi:hypothetical protein